MCNLTPKEQQVWDLFLQGNISKNISKKLDLKISTVQTYISKIRKKLKDAAPKVIVKKAKDNSLKTTSASSEVLSRNAKLKRCSSFTEFKNMMKDVKVLGTTLEERVEEFRTVYCRVCIYPNKCNECPTKILMNKYLGC